MISGKLVVKEFGAQKIYCAKQEKTSSSADDSAQLKTDLGELRDTIGVKRASLEETSRALGVYKSYERNLSSRDSIGECIDQLSAQIANLRLSRSDDSQSSAHKSPSSVDMLETEMTKVRSEMEKRRRISLRMIGEISEQMGMSRSALIEDLGLDMCEASSVRGS